MSELVWCLITRNYYQVTTITINYQQDEPFYYFFKKREILLICFMNSQIILRTWGINTQEKERRK